MSNENNSNRARTADHVSTTPEIIGSAEAILCVRCARRARVHKNKSMQLHTMGSVTAEFEVRHRWRTTTLFSGRYALNAEHVHARSLQKLHLFDWHFRLGLHFACTCSSKYSVQRWVQRSRINIGSPSHFRGVWASPAPRREAPRGRTTPRLPVNDWGKVLLACTCVTSHATYKKKAGRDWILTRSVSLIFAILTRSLKRPGSIWAAGRLISQSAFVIP